MPAREEEWVTLHEALGNAEHRETRRGTRDEETRVGP